MPLSREVTAVDLLEHISGGVRLENHATPLEAELRRTPQPQESVMGLTVASETRVVVLHED